MSYRKVNFEIGSFYHIYNRGVDKRNIFMDKGDIRYFFNRLVDLNTPENLGRNINVRRKRLGGNLTVDHVRGERIVSVIAYCLLPNHFHMVLKEETDGGISKFMQKLGTSYTMFFNNKYSRSGSLFQGKFKANHISGVGSLELTSAYVNLNYVHHKLDPKRDLIKTSFYEYLGKEKGFKVCHKDDVLESFKSNYEYEAYTKRQSKYFLEKKDGEM